MRSRIHLSRWFVAIALMLQAWASAGAQALEGSLPRHEQEIVVTAARPVGAALGNPEPERQLDPADVAAYGASSVRDLVDALALETRGSGGGPALVLLNGRRIFSFSEVADIPPEAILRVDILSEEVARRYGQRVNSKVLNIVLRPAYSARIAELGYGQATAGGRGSALGSFTIARNGGGRRWNLSAAAGRDDPLLESERRVAGGLGEYRSLMPGLERFTIAGTAARQRPAGISYSATAKAEIRDTLDLMGPSAASPAQARPLRRERRDVSARINATAYGDVKGWQWTVAAEAQAGESDIRGERAGAAPYTAAVRSIDFSLETLANRRIATLPAGEAGLSLRAAFSETALRSRSSHSPGPAVALGRSRGTAYAALDLPLGSRDEGGGGIGDLSLGLGAQAVVGDLHPLLLRLESSLAWSPVRAVSIALGFEREEEAPSLEELGNPLVTLDNVPVFDFSRGETAIVRLRSGGNPALETPTREALRARLAWQASRQLNLSASYTRSRTTDLVGALPAISQELEQAFPERFVRDASGRLTELDQSAVNFRRAAQDQLRWGLNWNRTIERQQRSGDDGGPASPREAAAALDRNARVNLAVYHTVRLRDQLLVREGLPRIDFLDGGVAGLRGGRARHAVEAQASVGGGGIGARLNASVEGGSRTDLANGERLRFAPVARVDLRLFADLGQLMPRKRWTSGTRVTLEVDNLLDSRTRVRRAGGDVPEALQPVYLEPLGRSIKFSLRRVF